MRGDSRQRRPIVREVFQYFRADDQVEKLTIESETAGQVASGYLAIKDFRRARHGLRRAFHASYRHRREALRNLGQQRSVAATDVEHARAVSKEGANLLD